MRPQCRRRSFSARNDAEALAAEYVCAGYASAKHPVHTHKETGLQLEAAVKASHEADGAADSPAHEDAMEEDDEIAVPQEISASALGWRLLEGAWMCLPQLREPRHGAPRP